MTAMFCEKCGEKLPPQGQYCEQCGAPVLGASGPNAPEAPIYTINKGSTTSVAATPLQPSIISLQSAAGWGIMTAGLLSVAAAVLSTESPELIPAVLWLSFSRGLLPVMVGLYLLFSRARPKQLALALVLIVLGIALFDLAGIYPLVNIWNLEDTMRLFGIRLAADFIILWAVLLRFFRINRPAAAS